MSVELTVYASAARTATPAAPEQAGNAYLKAAKGVVVIIDVTAASDTPSVVATIEGKDPASAKWYNLLTAAAVTGTGTTVLRVYPGLTAVANLTATDLLPSIWRVVMTHGDADSITYTVGAVLFD